MGDLGDAITSLASVKSLGGGVYYCMDKPGCRTFIDRMPLLDRLFKAQDYIEDFLPHNGEKIDHDFSTFRNAGHPYGVQLAKLHANWVGASPDLNAPWISIPKPRNKRGIIIVSRTGRYQNPYFPWKDLVAALGPKMLFAGLSEEYTSFCSEYGYVDRLLTNDLYDLAQAIAGSEMLIANQSVSMAICEGLKHRCIQEVCLWAPDCLYKRPNAIHCVDGGLSFKCLGIQFDHEPYEEKPVANPFETPPGGWVLEYKHAKLRSHAFHQMKEMARANFPGENLVPLIMEQSARDLPPTEAMINLRRARELLRTL